MNNILLNDIVSVLRNGKTFYASAAIQVSDPELKTLFARMATVREEILTGLPTEAAMTIPNPTKLGALATELHTGYLEMTTLVGGTDLGFVDRLLDSEIRFVKAIDLAVADTTLPAPVRTVLKKFLPELKACVQAMRSRGHVLKLAA